MVLDSLEGKDSELVLAIVELHWGFGSSLELIQF